MQTTKSNTFWLAALVLGTVGTIIYGGWDSDPTATRQTATSAVTKNHSCNGDECFELKPYIIVTNNIAEMRATLQPGSPDFPMKITSYKAKGPFTFHKGDPSPPLEQFEETKHVFTALRDYIRVKVPSVQEAYGFQVVAVVDDPAKESPWSGLLKECIFNYWRKNKDITGEDRTLIIQDPDACEVVKPPLFKFSP